MSVLGGLMRIKSLNGDQVYRVRIERVEEPHLTTFHGCHWEGPNHRPKRNGFAALRIDGKHKFRAEGKSSASAASRMRRRKSRSKSGSRMTLRNRLIPRATAPCLAFQRKSEFSDNCRHLAEIDQDDTGRHLAGGGLTDCIHDSSTPLRKSTALGGLCRLPGFDSLGSHGSQRCVQSSFPATQTMRRRCRNSADGSACAVRHAFGNERSADYLFRAR
jgi:hypothetical protein